VWKNNMIYGLFLDSRIWNIDYLTNPFWKPDSFGVHIDMHPDAFDIPKLGIDPKYKFAIATEIWEIPMQKALEFLRNKGLKIILVPREVSKTKAHTGAMYNLEKFKYNDQYYFKPDCLLAAGKQYYDLCEGYPNRKIVGYPRYEIYLERRCLHSKKKARKRHKLEKRKKIIFFPSYPPIFVQTVDGKNVYTYLHGDLKNTMTCLERYAISHKNDIQVVSKIHPYAQKCYDKNHPDKMVYGKLEKYYKSPTNFFKVIGDSRLDSSVSRDMIIAADFVIGSTSMMLLEAALMNKPILNIRLDQERALKDFITFEGYIRSVNRPQDIPNAIDDMVNNPDKYMVDKSFIEHYLYKDDCKFCERLCNAIKEMLKD